MKIIYAKITGFNGIAGLSEIEIDFSKCKHNIIAIAGENGIGKSRLLNALTSIMPIPSEYLIPTMEASQEFKIIDDVNLYEIRILYPLTNNNKRGTTKGSIKKNGTELNNSGNITSYKEIVFSEFELDANFLALSRLSGDDRGIVDRKPAERRKYVSSMLNSLEVYNGIYKTLTKKANIFKSHVNNCSTKIQNIGDENYLRSSLVSTDSRIQSLEANIDDCKQRLANCNALLSVNNIDEKTKHSLEQAQCKLENAQAECKQKQTLFETATKGFSFSANKESNNTLLDNNIKEITSTYEFHKQKLSELGIKGTGLLNQIASSKEEIDKLKLKLGEKESLIDSNIEFKLEQAKIELCSIISNLSVLNIEDLDNITPEEVNHVISFIIEFVSEVDRFYESCDSYTLGYLRDINFDISKIDIEKKRMELQECMSAEKSVNAQYLELSIDAKIIDNISHKPNTCRINNCYFLRESSKLLESKYNGDINHFHSLLTQAEYDIKQSEIDIKNHQKYLQRTESAYTSGLIVEQLIKGIRQNNDLLSKFKHYKRLLDIESVLDDIGHEFKFNEFRDLNSSMQLSNFLIMYRNTKDLVNKLEAEQRIYQNNKEIIQEYNEQISHKEENLRDMEISYKELKREQESESSLVIELDGKLKKLYDIQKLLFDYLEAGEYEYECQVEYNRINEKFKTCSDVVIEMSELDRIINNMKNELQPLKEQRKGLEGKLTILDDYQREYGMYKEKFDLVDRLQRYSSPRSGGIQEMFMNIYMSKTLDLSNQLLGMLFNGQYQLLNYVIENSEFRMPFISNGMVVDDVSSGSRSQVCMMGMIINLVMRNQASTKFNITALDEIDSGLDYNNRYMFMDVLYKIIAILNIEQLFIVSHCIELETDNVDVILLSDTPDYNDMFANANIIWKRDR